MEEGKLEKTCGDAPVWWHPDGVRMRPLSGYQEHKLQIFSDRAVLAISPDEDSHEHGIWFLAWRITRTSALSIEVKLKIPEEILRRAFALDRGPHGSDEWLLKHYGADSAARGYYIRAGNYLNIPGPGTGRDGDPNVSILLDEDIQELLRGLLELPR